LLYGLLLHLFIYCILMKVGRHRLLRSFAPQDEDALSPKHSAAFLPVADFFGAERRSRAVDCAALHAAAAISAATAGGCAPSCAESISC